MDIQKVLESHAAWCSDPADGERADLSGAKLYGAKLYGANLYGANLYGADLSWANISGANLIGAKSVYSFGPMPTSGRICYAVWHGDKTGWMVQAGCFWGTIDALEKKVNAEHKCSVYLANIAILRAYKPK